MKIKSPIDRFLRQFTYTQSRLLLNISVAAGSILAGVLIFEGLCRHFIPHHYSFIFVRDTESLYRYRSSSTKRFQNGPYAHLIEINSLGFRGAPFEQKSGQRPIIVYGDSYIASEFTPEDATFTHQLSQYLRQMNIETPVINAGVPGFGPDQSFLRIKSDLNKLSPSVVVLAIFADNDSGDLIRNKLFRLDDSHSQLIRQTPGLSREVEYFFNLNEKGWITSKVLLSFLLRSADILLSESTKRRSSIPSLRWGRSNMATNLQWSLEEFDDFVVNGNLQVNRLFHDHYDADIALLPNSESARYKMAMMDVLLRDIALKVKQQNTQFATIFIPSPHDAAINYDEAMLVPAEYRAYRPSYYTDNLTKIAKKHRIPYLNLMPVFKENSPTELYHSGGNDHWNARGQALAAKHAALFLRETLERHSKNDHLP